MIEGDNAGVKPDQFFLIYRKTPEMIVQGIPMRHVVTGGVMFTQHKDGIHIDFHPKSVTIDGWVYDRRFKKRTVIVPKGGKVTVEAPPDRSFLYHIDGTQRVARLQAMTIVNKRQYNKTPQRI